MAWQIDPRQLGKLDSPQRIAWLRGVMRGYVTDLAARAYFRLPTICCDEPMPDPKAEALAACVGFTIKHELTPAECKTAFDAEWAAAMNIVQQCAEKLRMAGLSHIKITRSSSGVAEALKHARRRFPESWPFLADHDIAAIAAGFQQPLNRRGQA